MPDDTNDETPTYRYRYTGPAPVSFADLTPFGVTWVEHGDELELPVAIVHHELVPLDDETETATAEKVAEMYPELIPVELPAAYPDAGTIDDVLGWVDGDPDRAAEATTIETAGRGRARLLAALGEVMAPPVDPDPADPPAPDDVVVVADSIQE